MSNRLPVEVNPFRLVEQRRQLSGTVKAHTLPRLQELLVTAPLVGEAVADGQSQRAVMGSDEFTVELNFDYSLSQLPMISGTVCGSVALECQRCLEPVQVAFDAHLNVVVTTSQTDRRPEAEGHEICIVEDERLFLQDFIEDEVLLALPVVPRHERCEPVKALREVSADERSAETGDTPTEYPQERADENPFAALKDWKKTE